MWFLSLSLLLSSPAEARRKKVKDTSESTQNDPRQSEREVVFSAVYEALEMGKKQQAASALFAVLETPAHSNFHGEAWGQLGNILVELKLPFSALFAYQNSFQTDITTSWSGLSTALHLAEELGDTRLLAANVTYTLPEDVDSESRSRIAYLQARDALQRGELGEALDHLKGVEDGSNVFIESKNMEGVILSLQGRPEVALVPLQIALAVAPKQEPSEKLLNIVQLNLARAYYAAENFPLSAEHFAQVTRVSPYWPEAQFERAWAHFRMRDTNGAIGLLHTHASPFFEDEHYPESELLRIYSMFVMCKFQEAEKQIQFFEDRYLPHATELRQLRAEAPEDLFDGMGMALQGKSSDLPRMLIRHFESEDRMQGSVRAIHGLHSEAAKVQSMGAIGTNMRPVLTQRITEIRTTEGQRIQEKALFLSEEIDGMLDGLKITRLDLTELKQVLLRRAAQTGKMPEAKRLAEHKKRKEKKVHYWPYEGEYWADEIGYYKVDANSECPAELLQ